MQNLDDIAEQVVKQLPMTWDQARWLITQARQLAKIRAVCIAYASDSRADQWRAMESIQRIVKQPEPTP